MPFNLVITSPNLILLFRTFSSSTYLFKMSFNLFKLIPRFFRISNVISRFICLFPCIISLQICGSISKIVESILFQISSNNSRPPEQITAAFIAPIDVPTIALSWISASTSALYAPT